MTRALSFVLSLGSLAVLTETMIRTRVLDPVYFPPLTTTFLTLAHLTLEGPFWRHVGHTLATMLVGFVIAVLIAVPTGTLMGQWPRLRLALEPVVDTFRPMPSAAVIPVAILLFGLGGTMKVAVVIFGSIWPAILSTMDGIRSVDPLLVETGRLLGLRRGTLLRCVVIPAALPAIMTGLRISLGIALILTVTTEMVAGTKGLGYFILDAQRGFAFPEMFAGILMLGVLGYGLTLIFSHCERRLLFWHTSIRSEPRAAHVRMAATASHADRRPRVAAAERRQPQRV